MNTDLTEIDFLPCLQLETKMHVLETHPNTNWKKDPCSFTIAIEKKPPTLNLKAKIIRTLFLGYLIIKFARKLKNAIIFPTNFGKETIDKKLILMNDQTFFKEGVYKEKNQKIHYSVLGYFSFMIGGFLIKALNRCLNKIPIFNEFLTFMKIWQILQFVFILATIFLIPINVFLLDWLETDEGLVKNILLSFQIFFLFDMIMKFNKSFQENGVSVNARKLIIKNYLHTLFAIDFVVIFSLFFWRILPLFSFIFLVKI